VIDVANEEPIQRPPKKLRDAIHLGNGRWHTSRVPALAFSAGRLFSEIKESWAVAAGAIASCQMSNVNMKITHRHIALLASKIFL
jgi:hypothetical protein